MRACDYIANRLVESNIKNVYGIMGGGAAGLNDGFIKNENINFVCFHHEQGAANAALAESKLTNNFSVVNVTTGCGGLNCMTTLISAYQDSNSVIFLSGNVKLNEATNFVNKEKNINLRKLGSQEFDIINMVKNYCKFSHFIQNGNEIPYILEKAIFESTNGRKGPCWIDFPSDFQTFKLTDVILNHQFESVSESIDDHKVYEYLKNSQRPLIVAGYGIYLSDSKNSFLNFVEKYQIPFVTTYLTKELVDYKHPLNIGTFGVKGNRSANFAVQTCDLLMSLGCSMTSTHVGYNKDLFAPQAKKIMINIDKDDYLKQNVDFDLFLECDLRDFFNNAK